MNTPLTLFKTIHGSHLYGLNHAASDIDFYSVILTNPVPNEHGDIRKKNGLQVIAGSDDDTVFDLKTFSIHAYNGVPQALEAMFSPYAEQDLISAYRQGFHASVQSMAVRYVHAIEKFSAFTFKKRQHALRYALNLREAIDRNGRFNPVLSSANKQMISEMAMSKDYISHLRALSFFELKLNTDVIRVSLDADSESF